MTAPKMLLLTHDGRQLTSDGGHPSLMDIAIGISRQPRFGGQTGRWWSVIDHSLFCDELVQMVLDNPVRVPPTRAERDDYIRRCRLAVLLHDAHEALTGDVPTPLKTPDFKAVQEDLDRRIFDAYFPGGHAMYSGAVYGVVREIDLRALRAEAEAFLPHLTERIHSIFGPPAPSDEAVLFDFRQGYRAMLQPPYAGGQTEHPAVVEYVSRILSLL